MLKLNLPYDDYNMLPVFKFIGSFPQKVAQSEIVKTTSATVTDGGAAQCLRQPAGCITGDNLDDENDDNSDPDYLEPDTPATPAMYLSQGINFINRLNAYDEMAFI